MTPECFDVRPLPCPHNPPRPLPPSRGEAASSNRRDGGFVILGVESDSLQTVGLGEEADLWLDFDAVSEQVNQYASPSVSFDLQKLVFRSNTIVVIRVHEFEELPVLCKKEFHAGGKGPPVLRRGACYVRARHKPETSEIPSEEEMRELLDLAIEKGVIKFLARAERVGLFRSVQPASSESDESKFQKQLEEME
ncbi:MAG TPA: ATP-binding protein [Isosphaeraceae bacterium]|nr:ATP-binding protein [Isosphaeraceae bacterium]